MACGKPPPPPSPPERDNPSLHTRLTCGGILVRPSEALVAGEGGAGDEEEEEEEEEEEVAVVSWLVKTKTLGALPLSAA